VMHELCHIRHRNHGKGFYKLMDKVMPDWRDKKERLEKPE
jgi:predicted metal-dependent hydrolase